MYNKLNDVYDKVHLYYDDETHKGGHWAGDSRNRGNTV